MASHRRLASASTAALTPAPVDHQAEEQFLVSQVVRRTIAGLDLARSHCAQFLMEDADNLLKMPWDDIDISHLLDAEEAMARVIRMACGRPRTEDESTPARIPILSLTIDGRTFMLLPSEAYTYAAFTSAYPYTSGFDLVETTSHFVSVELG